jgi:hypothetical protein
MIIIIMMMMRSHKLIITRSVVVCGCLLMFREFSVVRAIYTIVPFLCVLCFRAINFCNHEVQSLFLQFVLFCSTHCTPLSALILCHGRRRRRFKTCIGNVPLVRQLGERVSLVPLPEWQVAYIDHSVQSCCVLHCILSVLTEYNIIHHGVRGIYLI